MDSPLELAIKQIAFARSYTLSLLEDYDDAQWFTVPEECTTHVAWQVAHLAMAQYGLCLFRQRGRADSLSESIDKPYAVYPNKLGALVFCSHHEMLHAGQIGLLRRLLGKTPIR